MNDKYLQYKIEDFVIDESFVDWVLNRSNQELWTHWMSKNPQFLEKITEARFLVENLKFKEEPYSSIQKQKLWKRIESSTTAKVKTLEQRRKIIRLIGITAIAASLAVLVFLRSGSQKPTSIYNDSLQAMTVTLPAQSSVALYGNSTISYDKNSWENERKIRLEGEAIFDVTKGVPFIIQTDNGLVSVLGTKFKVFSKGASFYVSVERGKVQVESGKYKKILTAGKSYVKNLKIDEIKRAAIVESNDTYYQFENQSLEEIIKILENKYDIKLEGNYDVKSLYTGGFDGSYDLKSALNSVFWTMRITYTQKGDTVTLNMDK